MTKSGACNNLISGFGTFEGLVVSVIDNSSNNHFNGDNCWYSGHIINVIDLQKYDKSMMKSASYASSVRYYLGHSTSNHTAPHIGYKFMGLYYIDDWCLQNYSEQTEQTITNNNEKKV